jgi:hypothetical protein
MSEWDKFRPTCTWKPSAADAKYRRAGNKLHIKVSPPRNWSNILFWSIVIGLVVINATVFGLIYTGV